MSAWLERLWYPGTAEAPLRRMALAPLAVAEAGFRLGVGLRSTLFANGVLTQRRVDGLRVVSVGNLNVGGAGKTPLTILVANHFQAAGERVVVLSRGYGRTSKDPVELLPGASHPGAEVAGDEPLLIAARCPGVPVLVGADRVKQAQVAVSRHAATVVVLDDGFQHRRLARDVDLVVIDGAARFGNGRLMPRGPLREPLSALSRATLACVRLPPGVPAPELALPIPSFIARFVPTGWRAPDGTRSGPDALEGEKVAVLTAIARPESFAATLRRLRVEPAGVTAFPDHHSFKPAELEATLNAAGSLRIVTTEKDRVRLPASFPAWTLEMELQLEPGDTRLASALQRST